MILFVALAIGIHVGTCLGICLWIGNNWKQKTAFNIALQFDRSQVSEIIKKEVDELVAKKVAEMTSQAPSWNL